MVMSTVISQPGTSLRSLIGAFVLTKLTEGKSPRTIEFYSENLRCFRQECLNENWFLSLEDAREKIEEWRQHYNRERPHGALDNLAPLEYLVAQEAIS